MNALFPKDRRWLRLATASAGAALWGTMLLGFYGLVYSPLQRREATAHNRIVELQTLLYRDANIHRAHRELQATVAHLESQIASVRQRIPIDPLEATFLGDATSIAEQERIAIDNFRRESLEHFPEYSQVEVVISGRGSFASICSFLHRVSQLERLSTVRQMSINSSGSNGSYPFEVVYSLQFGMQTHLDEPGQQAAL